MKRLTNLFMIIMLLIGMFSFTANVLTAMGGDDDTDDLISNDDDDEIDDNETEDDDLDEEEEAAYEREVTIKDQREDKFEIESIAEFGEFQDKIIIKFEGDGDPEIELRYESETATTETEVRFRVEFEALFEYIEDDTQALGYQAGEELISTDQYKFEDQEWKDLVYSTDTVDGGTVNVITAETVDGVFKLILQFSAEILSLNENATLTPNSLKIDVVITNFPFTNDSSKLALETKVKSEFDVEVDDDTFEETNGFSSEESQVSIGAGFFSWAEYAIVGDRTIDVLASSLSESDDDDDALVEGESSNRIFFSFNDTNPDQIVWDPKIGVLSDITNSILNDLQNTDENGLGSSLPSMLTIFTFLSLLTISKLRFLKRKN